MPGDNVREKCCGRWTRLSEPRQEARGRRRPGTGSPGPSASAPPAASVPRGLRAAHSVLAPRVLRMHCVSYSPRGASSPGRDLGLCLALGWLGAIASPVPPLWGCIGFSFHSSAGHEESFPALFTHVRTRTRTHSLHVCLRITWLQWWGFFYGLCSLCLKTPPASLCFPASRGLAP